MSQSALDRSTFEAIEAYVLGRMSSDEHVAFEQRVAGDAILRAEVELERENILAVEMGGLARTLRAVVAEDMHGSPASGSTWAKYLRYAAVIAVLLMAGAWWFTRPSTNEQLFAEHFTADAGMPVAMGASTDPAFDDAMVAYKLGDFTEAKTKWSKLLLAEPENDTLRYYIASASLAGNNAATAVYAFERLSQVDGSVFQERSRWFLFLAYLKTGQLDKLRALPLDDDPTYGERVQAIKAELN